MTGYPITPFRRVRYEGASVVLSSLDFGGEGEGVVIVHGIRDLAWSMAPIAAPLLGRYHVLAPDLRGHGQSEWAGAYTLTHFVADLRALLTTRQVERPIIIGHSLGGQIASQYAALYPEEVKALVLIDGLGPPRSAMTGLGGASAERSRGQIESLLGRRDEAKGMASPGEALERLVRNNPKLDRAFAEFLVREGTEEGQDGATRWRFDGRANEVWASVHADQNEERWGWIECPVLLVTGLDSMAYWQRQRGGDLGGREVLLKEQERRVAMFSNARHVAIEDAGHMVHFDQPKQLNEAIHAFFERLEGR